MKFLKVIGAIVLVAVVFIYGLKIQQGASYFPDAGQLAQVPRNSRDPAAIKKIYDYSHLTGAELTAAAKQRVIEGASILKKGEDIQIELGHFVLKDTQGNKTFACSKFGQVVITLIGDGSSVAGESPTLEVEGPCEVAGDINRVSALTIPLSLLKKEIVADGEYDYRAQTKTRLKVSNVADVWPQNWKIKSVSLRQVLDRGIQSDGMDVDKSGQSSSYDSSSVNINADEIQTIHRQPMIIEF